MEGPGGDCVAGGGVGIGFATGGSVAEGSVCSVSTVGEEDDDGSGSMGCDSVTVGSAGKLADSETDEDAVVSDGSCGSRLFSSKKTTQTSPTKTQAKTATQVNSKR